MCNLRSVCAMFECAEWGYAPDLFPGPRHSLAKIRLDLGQDPGNVFVITACELTGKAKKAYRRRQRRKPR